MRRIKVLAATVLVLFPLLLLVMRLTMEGADQARMVLLIRAPQTTPYETVVRIVRSAKGSVGDLLSVELELEPDGEEDVHVTIFPDSSIPPSLVQRLFKALSDVGVNELVVVSRSGGLAIEYQLFNSYDAATDLLAEKRPFILWFHADWSGESVLVQCQVFQDHEVIEAIGRYQLPVVRIDRTGPSDDISEVLSLYSIDLQVPLVVLFSPGGRRRPLVLKGQISKEQFLASLQRQMSPVNRNGQN